MAEQPDSKSIAVPAANVPLPGDEAEPNAGQTAQGPCHRCSGTGRLDAAPCPDCEGTGLVTVTVGDA